LRKSKSVRVYSPAAKKLSKEASPTKLPKSLALVWRKFCSFHVALRPDEVLSQLNVDNLLNNGVKIVKYLNLLGNMTLRSPQDSQIKTLIKTLPLKNGSRLLTQF